MQWFPDFYVVYWCWLILDALVDYSDIDVPVVFMDGPVPVSVRKVADHLWSVAPPPPTSLYFSPQYLLYKVIVTFICHISVFDFHAIFNYCYVGSSWKDEGDDKSRCCIKHFLYFSMFLGVELYRPFKFFHISMKYKIINMATNYDNTNHSFFQQ